jgi:phenylacetate-CoA ligase
MGKKVLIWNEEFETMPRRDLEKLQLERLKKTVAYCMERMPFYKDLYTRGGRVC